MNVIELLQGQLDENLIQQLSQHIGAESTEQTEAAASGIISTLVAGLNKNAATPDGALNGAGILQHILGNKQSNTQDMLGKATGLDTAQIGKLMIALAPMVLAALGKARKQEAVSSENIGDLLSGSVKSQVNQQQEMGLLQRFLDADGDGSVMDDIANMGMKFFLNRK